MEWQGATDSPNELNGQLETLHFAFLTADERYDPQFRMDREDIRRLISDLDQVRKRNL